MTTPSWSTSARSGTATKVITATPSSPGATTPARAAPRRARVFRRTRLDWLAGATGEAHDRADAYAREYGCALVREIPGHRVSDFPHALYKHKLAHADFAPADGIWVLEIQVRDLTLPVGAFYEDVLLRGLKRRAPAFRPSRLRFRHPSCCRSRRTFALQSGSCGSTSRLSCSSDSCQPR